MATDIFPQSSSDLVSSIVVIPLMVAGKAFGGLYFALETPCSFDSIKELLLVRVGRDVAWKG